MINQRIVKSSSFKILWSHVKVETGLVLEHIGDFMFRRDGESEAGVVVVEGEGGHGWWREGTGR